MTKDERRVLLRVICEAPPTRPDVEFGLQDKGGHVEPGVLLDDGALLFEGEARAIRGDQDDAILRGPFVHGPPAQRFLYLSCRSRPSPEAPWLFRLKVPLPKLGSMVLFDDDPGRPAIFEAHVKATGGGTVPLPGPGWLRVGDG
jgi:hypothetical protein